MAERGPKINRILKSRFFVIILTVCFVIFLVGFAKTFWRDWQIKKEIKQLEDTRVGLEQKKIKILDYLKEAESDSYAEKEARLHFGLVRPGETTVVLTENTETVTSTAAEENTLNNLSEDNISNFKKWWYYFFH